MHALHVSWEFPPVVVGGLGRHVAALTAAQAALGTDVGVLSRAPDGTGDLPPDPPQVTVLRAQTGPPAVVFREELLSWVLAMNHSFVRTALTLAPRTVDVVHAHDWLVAHAAVTIARAFGVPLVSTIHATEAGRHGGWLPGPMNRAINETEGWLVRNSAAVITCSMSMSREVSTLHHPAREPFVVPNGIDLRDWRRDDARARDARARFGPDAPLIAFVGRLEHEKGVHDLVDALPTIRRRAPGTRLVIAGVGTQADALRERVRHRRVRTAVRFTGHLEHPDLVALMSAADVVVTPSHYEPFGIVALEAAAVATPLIVSNVGGLSELARRGLARPVPPAEPVALAAAVTAVLADLPAARRTAALAPELLSHDFDWATIASSTGEVYERARATAPIDTDAADRPVSIPDGNLLSREV